MLPTNVVLASGRVKRSVTGPSPAPRSDAATLCWSGSSEQIIVSNSGVQKKKSEAKAGAEAPTDGELVDRLDAKTELLLFCDETKLFLFDTWAG